MSNLPRPTRTLCIVFGDLVGSTPLSVAAHREGRREDHESRVEGLIAFWRETLFAGGAEFFKGQGDGFLVTFADARAALEAVVAGCRRAEAVTEQRDLPLRIGLHLGAVRVAEDGDIAGADAALAQRVMACAEGGEILASEACAAHLQPYLPLDHRLQDAGERLLKGFDTPVRVFRLHAPGLPARAAPAADATALVHLPAALDRFIGRERERAELTRLLRDPQARCVTLVGPPGAGKTRLSIEAAREAAPAFPEGVVFAALEEAIDAGGVLTRIAAALSIPVGLNADPLTAIEARLTGRRLLLVLDNLEQALEAAPTLAVLLTRLPKLQMLTTSREPLQIRGEMLYIVDPLPLPEEGETLQRIRARDSVKLFVERAQARDRRFRLTAENAPDVARLCRTLSGMPLAIEIATAEVRYQPLSRLAQEIGSILLDLQARYSDVPERQRSLRAVFDGSFQRLRETDRLLFCQLGLFETPFDEDDVYDVCTGMDLADGLRRLCDMSLVCHDVRAVERPYRLLVPTREYARDRLGEPSGAVRRRFIAAFIRRAQRLRDAFHHNQSEPAALRDFQRDLENFRATWRLVCEDGSAEEIADLGMAATYFAPFLPRAANLEEWLDATERALRSLEDAARLSTLFNTRARLANLRGRYAEAVAQQRAALNCVTHSGAPDHLADLHSTLAFFALRAEDHETVRRHARLAIEIAQSANALESEATALWVLAAVLFLDDNQQAEGMARRSLALFEQMRQPRGMAHAYTTLAAISEAQGDVPGAERSIREAVRLCWEQRVEVSAARCLEMLGRFYVRHGDAGLADYLLRAVADAQKRLGMPETALQALPKRPIPPLSEEVPTLELAVVRVLNTPHST